MKSSLWRHFGQWESLQSYVETCLCASLMLVGIACFLSCSHWYCLHTKPYAVHVYRWPSALCFSGWSGNIHVTQVNWVVLKRSVQRRDELCMLNCCVVYAEVDTVDVLSFTTAIQRWEGRFVLKLHRTLTMEQSKPSAWNRIYLQVNQAGVLLLNHFTKSFF